MRQEKSFLLKKVEQLMLYLPHRLHLYSTLKELLTKLDIAGAKQWLEIQKSHVQVTGDGARRQREAKKYVGQCYQRLHNYAEG